MTMPVIDFDSHFAEFTSDWVNKHQDEYADYDALEEDAPKIYTLFLNTRASWLGNLTPAAYFFQFEDPKVLVDWMIRYYNEKVPVPDLLLERIKQVGKPCEKRLLAILNDTNSEVGNEAKMTAVTILREMKSTKPKMIYIRWQINREDSDELKDNAIESLENMGPEVVQPILDIFDDANKAGQLALLDVLSIYPNTPRIFDIAVRMFDKYPEYRVLLAGYLGKIGDERALPKLIDAAKEKDLRYLTFIEIRNAIERLGGICPDRDFEDDPEYEALCAADLFKPEV